MRVLLIQKPVAQLKRALEKQGHVVDQATDSAQADRLSAADAYHLVVLDLALPGKDGFALVKKWRCAGMNSHVVVLTSRHNADAHANVRALDSGADLLVTKPCDADELMAQIRALHRRGFPNGDAVLRIHDMEIDTSARLVKRAGQTVMLTPCEYDLLLYLAGNCGKVLSRSMILHHLYDNAEEITSNVLAVRISNLRGKLDRDFKFPLILTRYGTGYMLRGDS